MTPPEIILTILSILIGVGALLAGIGYFYGQYTQGKNRNELDTVNLFKERVDALEGRIKTQTQDIENLTQQVKELQIAVEERDKKLSETLAILQGRDPKMQEFIVLVQKYVEDNAPMIKTINEEVIPIVRDLKLFLNKQPLSH